MNNYTGRSTIQGKRIKNDRDRASLTGCGDWLWHQAFLPIFNPLRQAQGIA